MYHGRDIITAHREIIRIAFPGSPVVELQVVTADEATQGLDKTSPDQTSYGTRCSTGNRIA